MKSKIAAAIFNSGLLVMVLMLLSAPLLMGQLLGTFESGALGVTTTGVPSQSGTGQIMAAGFTVYPNVSDFAQYAQFSEAPVISTKSYQTDVTFTAFTGQQAAYNALFTIYNTGNADLRLTVEGGKLSTALPTSRVWLTLVNDGQSASTLVTQAGAKGEKLLKLAQLPDFERAAIVVGNDVVEAQRDSSTAVSLAKALERKVEVGEKVYFGPVYYNENAIPALSVSRPIVLKPQQKALLNLAVVAEAGSTVTSQSVLPLVITAE